MMPAAAIPFVDLAAQHAALHDELLAVFAEALRTAAFIGGPAVERFESQFAAFCGAGHAVGVASGTAAIHLGLRALGIGAGDRVVTVPNTFAATTEAITQAGATIELVDVERDTCLMDPNRLEVLLRARFTHGARTLRPRAVIPVHLFGQTADMTAIRALADRYELIVVEDAAQAHGASHAGRPAGSWGDAAAFSFYPGKNLGACGEGGAVLFADGAAAERARRLRNHGQAAKNEHVVEGDNARLDAIQAGFLSVKLRHLPAWNERRRAHAARYDRLFGAVADVRPIVVRPGNVPVYHLYVVHVADRNGLARALAAANIASGCHYPTPLHLQPCYARFGLGRGSFPVAEESAATLISLPLFPELTAEQIERVAAVTAAAVRPR